MYLETVGRLSVASPSTGVLRLDWGALDLLTKQFGVGGLWWFGSRLRAVVPHATVWCVTILANIIHRIVMMDEKH